MIYTVFWQLQNQEREYNNIYCIHHALWNMASIMVYVYYCMCKQIKHFFNILLLYQSIPDLAAD